MIEAKGLAIDSLESCCTGYTDEKWVKERWYAVYTRSRHEKFVDEYLQKKGIQTFLPLRRFRRRWTDRFKTIDEPLFKGYLFVHAPLKERMNILTTSGVVRLIGPPGGDPLEVPEKELMTVKRFIDEEIHMDPFPYLKTGQRVYIRAGPLKGAEGFIVRKNRFCRLVISLDLLMQSVSVEVDQAYVEPA